MQYAAGHAVLQHGKPCPRPFFESEQLLMVIIPRAPEQMAVFHEARGFPQAAIDMITDTGFVTAHIENRVQQVERPQQAPAS